MPTSDLVCPLTVMQSYLLLLVPRTLPVSDRYTDQDHLLLYLNQDHNTDPEQQTLGLEHLGSLLPNYLA